MGLKEAGPTLLAYGVAAVIIAVLIVMIFPVSCRIGSRTEGFENPQQQQITMCPEGSKSFYDKKGNLNCCSGEVNNDVCQGTTVCTFSSTADGLRFCSELTRRRKYLGEINPFVRKFLQSDPRQRFADILSIFGQVYTTISQFPDDKLSKDNKDKLRVLYEEELNFFRNESNAQTKLAVYEDETMYTIQKLENILRNSPILQDRAFIQQQTKKYVCSMQ
jgi:hypothetical protein